MFPFVGAWQTSIRTKDPGPAGRLTADQLVPPFVDRKSPSSHAAKTSAVFDGLMETSKVMRLRRNVQVVPPLDDSKSPRVVAANIWFPFIRSIAISKNAVPTNG